jgi:hypothetical protein
MKFALFLVCTLALSFEASAQRARPGGSSRVGGGSMGGGSSRGFGGGGSIGGGPSRGFGGGGSSRGGGHVDVGSFRGGDVRNGGSVYSGPARGHTGGAVYDSGRLVDVNRGGHVNRGGSVNRGGHLPSRNNRFDSSFYYGGGRSAHVTHGRVTSFNRYRPGVTISVGGPVGYFSNSHSRWWYSTPRPYYVWSTPFVNFGYSCQMLTDYNQQDQYGNYIQYARLLMNGVAQHDFIKLYECNKAISDIQMYGDYCDSVDDVMYDRTGIPEAQFSHYAECRAALPYYY